MVVDYPFKQVKMDDYIYREFNSTVDEHELVWHRDHKDRIVKVLNNSDWFFQLDNKLPIPLTENVVVKIPKKTFHRVIRGKTDLKIKIKEL
jgi:hypothetical protein